MEGDVLVCKTGVTCLSTFRVYVHNSGSTVLGVTDFVEANPLSCEGGSARTKGERIALGINRVAVVPAHELVAVSTNSDGGVNGGVEVDHTAVEA